MRYVYGVTTLIMLPGDGGVGRFYGSVTDGQLPNATAASQALLLFVKVGRPGKRMAWKDVAVQIS